MDSSRAIHVENLAYRYLQNERGLDLPGLDVDTGQIVLLTGPSGCGKSTLARCLTGLIPHLYRGTLSGRVLVQGLDTAHAPLWQLSEHVGMVFQNPAAQMLAATVQDEIVFGLENLGLPPGEIAHRLEQALQRFDLAHLRARSPLTLSGGEQQRLALASIVARRPPVLVLDEPLSMLDSTATESLVSQLDELARAGTTVLLCEHRTAPLRRIAGLRTVPLAGPKQTAANWKQAQADLAPRQVEPFTLQASRLSVHLGRRTILRDQNLVFFGSEVVAIVGRNGVGKTTLLRALAGLQHHGGTVQVDGKPPDLAMVFQNPDLQLFNATVRDEILYKMADPDLDWYRRILHILGLERYEDTPPLLLSEGEKKRLALAMALMRRPAHGILLDEPALGQDAAHRARLLRLARMLARSGRLVIMTTHDLALAAEADRMLLQDESGFIADGPPAEVLGNRAAWERAGLLVPGWVREQIA